MWRLRLMMTRLLFALTLLSLLGFASPPSFAASKYEQSLKELTEGVTAEAVKVKKQRLAVMDFTTDKGEVTPPGQFLAEELATHLLVAGELKVVDRKLLGSSVKQQGLTQLDPAQAKVAQKVAKAVRADVFVTGTFIETGEGIHVTTTLLEPSTMQVIGATRAIIPKTGPLVALMNPPNQAKITIVDTPESALPPGLGFASNEFYQLTVTTIEKQENQVRLDLVLESTSSRDVKILCKLQKTYLEDEHGAQWRQELTDNREGLCSKGMELSPREKERTLLFFTAKDKAVGTMFTLHFHEAAPRRDAVVTIGGLKSVSAAAPASVPPPEPIPATTQ